MKNTGGANGLMYQVSGSLDGGVAYDLTLARPANLAAGAASGAVQNSVRVTHLKVQVKAQVAGSQTAYSAKACASSI